MKNERRRKRSEMVQEAASLYLEAVIERNRIKAMALASDEGLLVAGAGDGYDHEWLAALGVVTGEPHFDGMIAEITRGEGMVSFDVPVHGRTLRLSAVGKSPPSLEDASAALSRIFAPLFGASTPVVATS
ncbi:hypothetical protein [Polyangium spumosum]|uniref:Roadblock/LC7 domain-containing protein n=1 Tax=Polyangium spumosum TaxID=889282 RepID=A0A6N7PL24_9BACT|nr:hypothetical protein [Polyangium spumosum]MRG92852.1 hypothetical protein [Polyangium spumosum]